MAIEIVRRFLIGLDINKIYIKVHMAVTVLALDEFHFGNQSKKLRILLFWSV